MIYTKYIQLLIQFTFIWKIQRSKMYFSTVEWILLPRGRQDRVQSKFVAYQVRANIDIMMCREELPLALSILIKYIDLYQNRGMTQCVSKYTNHHGFLVLKLNFFDKIWLYSLLHTKIVYIDMSVDSFVKILRLNKGTNTDN